MESDLSKYINAIKSIKKQAQLKKHNPQFLIKKLENDAVMVSMNGYSRTLPEAMLDSGFEFNKSGAVSPTPSPDHSYTEILDRSVISSLIPKSDKKVMDLTVPKSDQYFVCDHICLDANKGKMAKKFRRVTFHDVIDAVNRFFSIKAFLEQYDYMGDQVVSSKTSAESKIFAELNHYNRIAQHGFIREALDALADPNRNQNVFKALVHSSISNSFKKLPSGSTKALSMPFAVSDAFKTIGKQHPENITNTFVDLANKMAKKVKGLKYVIIISEESKGLINAHKVTKTDFSQIIKAVKKSLIYDDYES